MPSPPGPAEDTGTGAISDMVVSALEEGLAGVSDPAEAASVLRELADMLEGGAPSAPDKEEA